MCFHIGRSIEVKGVGKGVAEKDDSPALLVVRRF